MQSSLTVTGGSDEGVRASGTRRTERLGGVEASASTAGHEDATLEFVVRIHADVVAGDRSERALERSAFDGAFSTQRPCCTHLEASIAFR